MIITHRSGDPEDLIGNNSALVNLASVSGVQMAEKALVKEDHLVEIAGSNQIFKFNQVYDAKNKPRWTTHNFCFIDQKSFFEDLL